MNGRNTLRLCPAQMIVIAQEWIDRNFATKPKVTDVSARGNSVSDRGFEIDLSDEPRPEPVVPAHKEHDGRTPPYFDPKTGL